MIDASSPSGDHMGLDVFEKVLSFAEACRTRVLIVSGGEPFEHPDIAKILSMCAEFQVRTATVITVCSNGLFALDDEKLALAEHSGLIIQVTNDKRYYGRDLWLIKHKFDRPLMCFEDRIQLIVPCRRTKENNIPATRISPMCFNLRSAVRTLGFENGLIALEANGKYCTPSINIDGGVVAGEADTCFRIGDVSMRPSELTGRVREMRCGRCGLRAHLSGAHRAAIGEQA
jgi:hypothetical protein